MEKLSIYEFLEDWDDDSLPPDEWEEEMEEAVQMYRERYGTELSPRAAVRNYKSWKRDKYRPDE